MHAISSASASHVKITDFAPYVSTCLPVVAWVISANDDGSWGVAGVIIRDGVPAIAIPGSKVEYVAGPVPE